jgi:hypothetical protein
MNEPWRIPLPTWLVLKAVAPNVEVPKGGWNAAEFARQGRYLIIGLDRLAKITQRKAMPVIRHRAMVLFKQQLDLVIEKAGRQFSMRSIKAEDVPVPDKTNALSVWLRSLEEVFAEQGLQSVLDLVPPIQSVMGQAYSRTAALMGQQAHESVNARIAHQSQGIAQKITSINDTTRQTFQRAIMDSIEANETVTETAARLRELLPQFERGRINTISRTETSRAWTQGSVQAFQQSDTLTHVSVIGCESREEDRWNSPSFQQFMYNGQGTCNIQMVPVVDADKLNFHPNHTGTVVPASFRNADGSATIL